MQIIKLNQDGTPEDILNITGLSEQEIQSRYPDYILNEFQFEQPLECYTYDEQAQTFSLKQDWEALLPPPPPVVYPKVSPVTYKMLWTLQERSAIRGMRATDPVIEDLLTLIDDPRMEHVNLNLQSVQDGIMYCLNALATAGVIANDDVQTRFEQILTGQPL